MPRGPARIILGDFPWSRIPVHLVTYPTLCYFPLRNGVTMYFRVTGNQFLELLSRLLKGVLGPL
jgi:hypothetical protein